MRRITLAIFCLALASWPARAQTSKLVKPLVELNGPCNPLGDTRPQCQPGGAGAAASVADKVLAALAKPFQDLATFIGEDADGAIALSTAIPALQDGHGQQCWMATKQFAEVIKAHPVPLTLKVSTDLEALRLLMMASNNLCANVHCTQVFGDLATGIAQLAPLNASIPIPSLHDLCAKIPQVAVVPPVTAAAAAAPAAAKP
jgi:hypothetical protein